MEGVPLLGTDVVGLDDFDVAAAGVDLDAFALQLDRNARTHDGDGRGPLSDLNKIAAVQVVAHHALAVDEGAVGRPFVDHLEAARWLTHDAHVAAGHVIAHERNVVARVATEGQGALGVGRDGCPLFHHSNRGRISRRRR